jgi:hypothetical protein
MREMRNAYIILARKYLREMFRKFKWFHWEYVITNKTYLREVTWVDWIHLTQD